MPIVEVPGFANVEFPDDTPNEIMEKAIKEKFFPQMLAPTTPQTSSALGHYTGQFAKGVAESEATALKGAAVALTPKTPAPVATNEYSYEGEKYGLRPGQTIGQFDLRTAVNVGDPQAGTLTERTKATPLWKEAEDLEAMSKGIPEDPTRTGYASNVAKGLGSATGMLTGTVLTPGAPVLGVTATGMLQGAGEQIEEGMKAGKKIEELDWPYLLGAGLGATEVAPIEIAFRFLKRYGGKSVVGRIAATMAVEGASEAVQEALQQIGGNLVAKKYYDAERDPFEGVSDAALTALGVGAIMGGGVAIATPKVKTPTARSAGITEADFDTGASTDAEINDAAMAHTRRTVLSPQAQAQTRQEQINKLWAEHTASQAEPVAQAPTPAPVGTGGPEFQATATRSGVELPQVSEQGDVGRVPPPLLTDHPVQMALQEVYGDQGTAMMEGERIGAPLGIEFHAIEVPGGWQLRLGPEPSVLGPEYEEFRAETAVPIEPSSAEAMATARAQAEINRIEQEEREATAQQPNLVENFKEAEQTREEAGTSADSLIGEGDITQGDKDAALIRMLGGTPKGELAKKGLSLPEQPKVFTESELNDVTDLFIRKGMKGFAPETTAKAIGPEVLAGTFKSKTAATITAKRLGSKAEVIPAKDGGFSVVKFHSFGPQMLEDIWTSRLVNFLRNQGNLGIPALPKMMRPEQVVQELGKYVGKQFKAEELADVQRLTGLNDWLAEYQKQGRNVSKAELKEYLEVNGIKVEEVSHGNINPEERAKLIEERGNLIAQLERGEIPGRGTPEFEAHHDRIDELGLQIDAMNPKYENSVYNLPGGSNYIELVLTSPQARKLGGDTAHFEEGKGAQNIGWIRGKEFSDAEGRRIFHIEEIQSKRHQEGRKEGYAESPFRYAVTDLEGKTIGEFNNRREAENFADAHPDSFISGDMQEGYTPDAPFQKTWPTLLLKRAIKYAVENGYDGISWTTGEQQNARYNLSQVADKLTYFDGQLKAYKDGRASIDQMVKPENLHTYVGQDLATKLINEGVVQGQDFELGGHGMKRFYGSMSPQGEFKGGILSTAMRDAMSPFKVKEEIISGESTFQRDDVGNIIGFGEPNQSNSKFSKQPGIILSDEMKASFGKGKPMNLYSGIDPQMLRDIWGKTKVVDEQGRPKPMYHGSRDTFDKFDPEKQGGGFEGKGIYLTDLPEEAALYTEDHLYNKDVEGAAVPNIRRVFVDIRNPFDLTSDEALTPKMKDKIFVEAIKTYPEHKAVLEKFRANPKTNNKPYILYNTIKRLLSGGIDTMHEESINHILSAVDYDGIKAYGGRPSGEGAYAENWIAFSPDQVKTSWGKPTQETELFSGLDPKMFSSLFNSLLGRGTKLPGGLGQATSRTYRQTAGLPFWTAEINERFKPFYDAAGRRRDSYAKATADAMNQVSVWLKMNPDERSQAVDILQNIEGKKLKQTPSPEIIAYEENGIRLVKQNQAHLDEFAKWLGTKNLSAASRQFLLAWKTTMNDSFANHYNTLAKRGDVDKGYLDDLLNNVGFVSNYMPHMWYGEYYVEGKDADGKVVARISLPKGMEVTGKILGRASGVSSFVKDLRTDPAYKGLEWSDPQKSSELERYYVNTPVPIDVIERVLGEASDSLKQDYPEIAGKFQSDIQKNVAHILKTKGFGNFAQRKGILGYEKTDVMKVFYDYVLGVNSSLAKMQAAKEYTDLLFKTKPKSEDIKLFTDFVEDEMSPYGKFDRSMDSLRSLLFARHLGLRIKPAVLNLGNMLTTSIPILGIYTKGESISSIAHTKAAADISRQYMAEVPTHRRKTGIRGLEEGNVLTDDEVRSQVDLLSDDTIQHQMMNEYKGRFRDNLKWQWRAFEYLATPMEMTEWYIRATTALSAYRAFRDGQITHEPTLKKYGLTAGQKLDMDVQENYEKGIEFAKNIVSKAHGDYSSFNKPPVLRSGKVGALGRSMYTFRFFTHHMLEMWNWMLRHEETGRGKVAFAKSMAGTAFLGGIGAAPVAGLLMAAYKYWDKDEPEAKVREAYPDYGPLWDGVFEGAPALGGAYLGGSLEVGFPTNVSEAIGVPAAIVEDITNGVEAWNSGNKGRAAEYLMPLVVGRDLLSAYRGATTGQRTVGGRPIAFEDGETKKFSTFETALKALGFRPTSMEKDWRVSEHIKYLADYKQYAQRKFADRYTNSIAAGNIDGAISVLDEVTAWNMLWLSKERPEFAITKDALTSALESRAVPKLPAKTLVGRELRMKEAFK